MAERLRVGHIFAIHWGAGKAIVYGRHLDPIGRLFCSCMECGPNKRQFAVSGLYSDPIDFDLEVAAMANACVAAEFVAMRDRARLERSKVQPQRFAERYLKRTNTLYALAERLRDGDDE